MVHSFDTEIAMYLGIEPAILLSHISFWIEKNRANEKHLYDGNYWMYNSVKAFCELFPYMSRSTIRRSLKVLEDNDIIISGNYNTTPFDRTLWYAITQFGYAVLKNPLDNLNKSHLLKTENGLIQNDQPIPDIIPDIIPIKNTDIEPASLKPQKPKPEKKKYGTSGLVFLTDDEYAKFLETYGEEQLLRMIDKLDAYKQSHGRQYKSDAGAMREWVVEALGIKPKPKIETAPQHRPQISFKHVVPCPSCGVNILPGERFCQCCGKRCNDFDKSFIDKEQAKDRAP